MLGVRVKTKILLIKPLSLDELLERLKTAKYISGKTEEVGMDIWRAKDIVSNNRSAFIPQGVQKVEFATASLRVLFGFDKAVRPEVFLNPSFLAAHQLGFVTPVQVLHLRMAYKDQPLRTFVHVGMIPLWNGEDKWILTLSRGDFDPFIDYNSGEAVLGYDPDSVWVFQVIKRDEPDLGVHTVE